MKKNKKIVLPFAIDDNFKRKFDDMLQKNAKQILKLIKGIDKKKPA